MPRISVLFSVNSVMVNTFNTLLFWFLGWAPWSQHEEWMNKQVRGTSLDTTQVLAICFLMSSFPPWAPFFAHISIILSGTRYLKMKVWSTGEKKGSSQLPGLSTCSYVHLCTEHGHSDQTCLLLSGKLILLVIEISARGMEASPLRPPPCSLSI